MKRNFAVSKLAVFTLSVLGTSTVQAGDLRLQPTVSSELIFQNIDSNSETDPDRSINTLRLEPSLKAVYKGARLTGSFNGQATHLERDVNEQSVKNDYLEYDYSAEYEVFERLLSFIASGSSKYRNANTNNFLVTDFLNNSGDLARTETNRIGVVSDFTRGQYVSGSASTTLSTVKTDRNNAFTGGSGLNNDTFDASVRLSEGDSARSYAWEATGNYSDTDRAQANLGSFKSQELSGYIDKQVYGNFAFRVNAYSEKYEFGNNIGVEEPDRTFDSYGAGITYRVNNSRFISLTANKANSSNEDNDDDVYPAVHLNWAFTERTSVEAKFGKRFYGDAASFKLAHATRKIRTSLTYTEDVRNFSQFQSDPENLGVFVCPGSSFSLDCFQPESLNFSLEEGDQIVQLIDDNNALEDDVVLRKSGNFEIGYQSRKATIGVFAQYSEDDYLAQERVRETRTVGINGSYRVGAFTSLSSVLSFAKIEREGEDVQVGSSDNINFNLSLSHQLSRYFAASVGYTYIDRSGDIREGGFGNDYNDQRLTLGLTYTY